MITDTNLTILTLTVAISPYFFVGNNHTAIRISLAHLFHGMNFPAFQTVLKASDEVC